ncbi:MAG TPA: hypothetical protein PLO89_01330 [Spirochaetota bacterium]|nr:hypothetical protein [Spirochaetota bacterium]
MNYKAILKISKKSFGETPYRNLFLYFLIIFFLNGCALFFLDNRSFLVYETPHFVFFYLEDSKIGKDVKDIAVESEKALLWASELMGINLNLKVNAYLYDDYTKTSYYKTVKNSENSSTFANEYCFQYCYNRDGYDVKSAIPVILHETMHIIQASIFSMNNIGMYEGHSTYMQIKYELYSYSLNYSDKNVFNGLKDVVKESLLNDKEYPRVILKMSNVEFQNVDSSTLIRNPKKRYEICASFIAFLANKYGIEKLNQWFYNSDRDNFIFRFASTYEIDFYTFEKEWLIEILSE